MRARENRTASWAGVQLLGGQLLLALVQETPLRTGLWRQISSSAASVRSPCVYTAQGFEFDYVGVIFGKDLTYDQDQQRWIGNKQQSYDTMVKRSGDQFVDVVKNTYRVLLTRGLKGCYMTFLDKQTEWFVKNRMI